MNTRLLLSFIFLITISLSGLAQDRKTTRAKLSNATVFFKGAELVHSASYSLAKGENEIYIEGLSPNIDRNSLKIKATNGVVVSAYEFSVDFLSESKSVTTVAKRLQDSVSYYEKKLEQVNTDINVTTNLISLLQKGTDKNIAGSEKGLGIDELVKAMDYYKTKSAELQTVQAANLKKKNEYTLAMNRINSQLGQESLKNNKSTGLLKLNLSSPAITNCTFTVSYYTSAAGWMPYYDINIASIDKPIKIMAKSKVRQTTGLDWDKVNLVLSTATPGNGKIAPLFDTWFLSDAPKIAYDEEVMEISEMRNSIREERAVPAMAMAVGKVKDDKKVLAPLYMVDGNPVDYAYYASLDNRMVKSRSFMDGNTASKNYGAAAGGGVYMVTLKSSMDDYVTQSENELNVVYNIDLPYTIPGNGKEQTIDLQTKETQAEYKYYCAPKLDTETYLVAEIPDWQKLNLLKGKANITYDGTYIGESLIDPQSTQEKLTLTLGTDKRVAVKREKMQDFSSTRFLGNDTKQVFTYKLTVKNNQNKSVKLSLNDQYPVSMQKNIEVELLIKDTTPFTTNKEETGIVSWDEEIKPGETKEYRFSYSVKYPKGSTLNL